MTTTKQKQATTAQMFNSTTYNKRELDRVAIKPDSEPLTDSELEALFIYEFGQLFETTESDEYV